MLRKKLCLVIFDFAPKGGPVWFTVVIELQILRLFNVFTAFKGTNFLHFVFAVTVAGVVSSYGGRKKSPRTSSIVQIIFYFWFLRSVGIV